MEKEIEIKKLVNVLRKTGRTALQTEWTQGNGDSAAYLVGQYNRVFNRLKSLEPGIDGIFEPLPEDSSVKVVAIACRQLAAWFEDDVQDDNGFSGFTASFDSDNLKDFWRKGADDIRDLGEFIRENVEHWAGKQRGRRRKSQSDVHDATPEETPPEADVDAVFEDKPKEKE